jgi:NAD(P)H-dependent flavin oxidoreductase YrpB (nitropropane dioxygenase family)
MNNQLKPLFIGDLQIKIPILQGGMGVKVSMSPLASAVANCGAAGTIASVGLNYGMDDARTSFVKSSNEALQNEIRKTRELTTGVFGVNIMAALSNYEDLVRVAIEEKADFIVSGAGLPLALPEFTAGSSVKLIPIVSSARAADIILKTWKRRYNKIPDAIVVEGPMAGGHLGFKPEDIKGHSTHTLEQLVVDVLKATEEYKTPSGDKVPVIAAGGVFNGEDIAKFIRLGASGVQMATRFVATFECSMPDSFKKLYISAKEEDIVIIDSPVGMPGRAIITNFVRKVVAGEKMVFKCLYKCLRSCDPKSVPYCIAKALCNAFDGDLDNAVVFAGANASKVSKITSVKELIQELICEANAALRIPLIA